MARPSSVFLMSVLCSISPHPTPALFFSSILSIVIVCDAKG
jgi:hypothetical protein